MTEEAFVIFVYLILYKCFLPEYLIIYSGLEPFYNLIEDRLVEHHSLAIHNACDITACKQLPTLQYNTVASCIKRVYP